MVLFDGEADVAVGALRRRLTAAGVPTGDTRWPAHLVFASAATVPRPVRADLRRELALLALPNLWLHHLTAFTTTENVLALGAVVDGELLAVHSAVHDVLAGRVSQPSAYHLPGNWLPHCALAQGVTDQQVVAGFAALHPVTPVRAGIAAVAVADTRTGELDQLWHR